MKLILAVCFVCIPFLYSVIVVHSLPDYDRVLAESIKVDKPLFVLFTADNCENPKLTNEIFQTSEKLKKKLDQFVYLPIYIDDESKELISKRKYTNKYSKSKGQINSTFLKDKFGETSVPFYVVINSEDVVLTRSSFLDSEEEIIHFLEKGLSKF